MHGLSHFQCFFLVFFICVTTSHAYGEGHYKELGLNQLPVMSTLLGTQPIPPLMIPIGAWYYYQIQYPQKSLIQNVDFHNKFVERLHTMGIPYYQLQEVIVYNAVDGQHLWDYNFILMQPSLSFPFTIDEASVVLMDSSVKIDWTTFQEFILSTPQKAISSFDNSNQNIIITDASQPHFQNNGITNVYTLLRNTGTDLNLILPKGGYDSNGYCDNQLFGGTQACRNRVNVHFYYSLYLPASTGKYCANGYYTSQPVSAVSGYYLQDTIAACTLCPLGTWNTCINSEMCGYRVSQKGESVSLWVNKQKKRYKDDIYVFDNYNLLGKCYPCRLAFNRPKHYGSNTLDVFLGDRNDGITLPFYCLGGAKPPYKCPEGTDAVIWGDGYASNCTCRAGTYNNISLKSYSGDITQSTLDDIKDHVKCLPCPAGYYCIGGVPTICPMGTFSKAGAQQCTECDTSPCDRGLLRPVCMPGSKKDADPCVSCLACRGIGSTDPNSVECLGNVQLGEGNEINARRGSFTVRAHIRGGTEPVHYLPPLEAFFGNASHETK